MSETYTTGGDSGYPITPPKLIGQTFTPLVEHKLDYIDLNILKWTTGGDLKITVHDLEDDPDMTGSGISTGSKFTMEPRLFFQFTRTRIIMDKVTLHKDHPYGFCISNQPEPWWNEFVIKYDLADATYPRGQRFTKDNRADPPTYYPDSDLIFAEFGRPVAPPVPPDPEPNPPPTPPDPPIDKWLGFRIHQERTILGEKIILYTNVPCHLWMRWSFVPPRIHKVPITRRGLTTMSDFYYCFDVYLDNEQEEPGDTLAHTFIKEPWPYCETRWYYFHGQVDSINVPSTSPIFKKHPIEPTYIPACYALDFQDLYTRRLSGYQIIKPFKPCRSYMATKLTLNFTWAEYADYVPAEYLHFLIFKCEEDGHPIGAPLRRVYVETDIPHSPEHRSFTAYFSPLTLEVDQPYGYGFEIRPTPPGEAHWSAYWHRADHGTCYYRDRWWHRVWSEDDWLDWVGYIAALEWYYDLPETVSP